MNSENYKPTLILIALNIIVYIYTSIMGGNWLNTSSNMVYQWGQVNAFVFEGAYWQLFTSMFIHANISHLAGNLFFLLVFGLRAEEMFSLSEFFGIYFLGGLAGNLLSLTLGPILISVGASGAIFAIFGAAVIYARRSVRQSIIGALLFAFFLLFISAGQNVNNFAHIGGLVIGLLMGYLIATRRKPTEQYTVRYSFGTPF
jgi:rhomboid protease GluP